MPLKMKDSEIMQCVQVKVEIGHRARPRAKPTKEGFTHDWTVYVRAPEGSNLAHFVEKVEFHLHDTFADPHRVVTKPPYHVSEVGYADFDLPIEIYFKNKGEPQKIKFNYNLFLQTHKPVNYVRCEKLTFVNPTDEFKKKLIKAGGVYVLPPGETQFADFCGSPIKTESVKKQKQPSTISSKVHVLPPGKAQFADLCGPPIKTESLKEQKQPSTISSKVHLLPPGETQFADLFGPPIKTESIKKQKQPSTISSKVLALPPVDAQFADLFGLPIKVTKQKQPSIISSKENVSKQLLNFSGDEKPSSSGKNISASLNSTAKQVKIYNKSKSHDAAYTSSSSSSVSISKEKIQKTQSSKEKPSCKESNNSSKMVPNPSPLPSHKRPSDHPIPSENNQTKIQVKTDKVEKYEHSLSKSTDAKKSKSVQRKRSGSLVSELDSSMAKIQQVSIKHLSKVNPTELKEDLSFPSVNMVKSTCKIDRIYEVKSQRKTDISPTCGISKSSYQIHSRSALKQLMDELDDDSADDDDIIDTVDVFSQPKLAKNSPLVKPVKESSALSCKNNSDKSRKAISEISPTIKNPTISKDSIRKSFTKSVFEKKTESLNFNDTRNKTHHGTQPPTNTPSPVTKSKEGESSEEKSKCKIDSIYEVKSQRKTVRKYVNVKTKSSSSSESRKQDEKHPNSFPIDIPSESDDDFFADITGSDLGVDLDISPNYGTSKTSNQIYSRSDLKQLMDELEDNSADDDDDITKSSSEGENDQKDKSSNRKVKFEISTDAIKEQINRSRSSVSALNHSVAKEQQNNMEDLSQVTLMELKEDLYISSDSSSESDDDFFLDISGSESDMDLDISPTFNISKTSNHIYSKSALKMLMHELEDSSADDEDDRKSEITTTKSEQRKRSGSPISTLFGSMAKKQRVSMKHLSNDSLMELKEDLSRSR